MKDAIYSVIDESVRLNREQELVWAVWFIKVFDVQVSQKIMIQVLKCSNDLAVMIMLDIVSSRGRQKSSGILEQRKRIREEIDAADVDDSEKNNTVMWTSHWLLAYEANRQKWLNFPDNPMEYARKNSFFKGLLEKGIKFYNPDFSYPEPAGRTKNHEYAKRSELFSEIRNLKKIIAMRIGQPNQQEQENLTREEAMLYERFISDLETDEQIY